MISESFFEQLRALLSARPTGLLAELPPEMPVLRTAAVLVPLYLDGGAPYVVLTRRTDGLSQHPGQIAFPGGGIDPGDADARETALREAEEEIGLARADVDVLGPLDPTETITRFRVSPFVGRIPSDYPFRPSEREVAEILRLPLLEFLLPGALETSAHPVFGQRRTVYGYTVRGQLVWGATGRIVHHLLELVGPLLAP